MAPTESRFKRLAVAIGIGFVIEAFLFSGAVVQPWGNKIANLSQEPAYQLVIWVERIQQPGLAGQAAYTILMVIIQWMIWSVLS